MITVSHRHTESGRTCLDQERADLDAVRVALPDWYVWAVWNCGYRTWHAVPDFPGSDGLAADHLAQSAPGRVTAHSGDGLIRACKEGQS